MYRILIVDDEPHVVDWISGLVESQAEPELDVCRAYSAFEALEWLNRAKIDIMITDIGMPEMNGISLLEKVKTNWPKCRVILLTAHARFDYAFEAIKHKAVSYLLKTEDDGRILSEINKAIEQLENEYKDLKMLMEARKKINESLSLIRKEFLQGVLMGEYNITVNIQEHFKKLDIRFDPMRPYLLVIGRLEPVYDGIDKLKAYDLMISIEHIAQQNFQQYAVSYSVEYEQGKIAWIMQSTALNTVLDQKEGASNACQENLNAFIKGAAEIIQKICKDTMGISVSFILSGTHIDWKDISERFNRMEQMQGYMGYTEGSFIMTDTAFLENTLKMRSSLTQEFSRPLMRPGMVERLHTFMENGDKKAFIHELENICGNLETVKSKNCNQALEVYYSIALMFMSFINRKGLAESIAFRIGLNKLLRADMHDSWKDAADYILRLADVVFELQNNEKNQLTNDLVSYINDFIELHITGDLSLVKLSEVTGYNPSYISRLYKEIAGENLNDYIGRKRFEKAGELLKDGRNNINDVALKAGFQSRTYFNRFIKKMTGMSPKEFQNHLIEKEKNEM